MKLPLTLLPPSARRRAGFVYLLPRLQPPGIHHTRPNRKLPSPYKEETRR